MNKFAMIAVAVLFFSVTTPTKSDPVGGIYLFSTQLDALTFCAQTAVQCESIEYVVHPVAGTGWMVAYSIVNHLPYFPPQGGTPITGGGTIGGGSGGPVAPPPQ